MTIKKMMMAAGAVDGPQVIAPSSNDFDYTNDGSDDWSVAGNTNGDHTIGASIKTVVHADSSISSLITLDDDFVISFTVTEKAMLGFGVHAIDEDDTRAQSDRGGLQSMTNSYEWHDDYYSSGTKAAYGGSAEGSFTSPANGSTIVIRRVSGEITLEDDGSVIHTWGTSYSGTMRMSFHASGGTTPDVDNLFFTDTEKVQRDGFYNESVTTSSALGNYASGAIHVARRWKATRTGTLTSLSFFAKTASTPSNFHAELWTDDGTNPAAQVGGVTNTLLINSSGKKTFTFSTEPEVTKGQSYWAVIEDEDHASTNANVALWEHPIADIQDSGSGYNDTVTSITASKSAVYAMEAVINATKEPIPGHDTLLLIQNEGSNDSQTFSDSSQLGLTCTANNQVHWDNGQTLGYGTTSIYMDGTDDYVSLADADRWDFSGDFTLDLIIRCTDVSTKRFLIDHTTGGQTGQHGFNFQIDSNATLQFYANVSGGGASASKTGLSNNTNHHLCAVRSRTRLGVAIDGNWGSLATLTGVVNNISAPLRIGSGGSSTADFIGWMKRIRITKDAKWEPGVSFTPPSGLYPVD